jgi:uncharacterized protein DUF3562
MACKRSAVRSRLAPPILRMPANLGPMNDTTEASPPAALGKDHARAIATLSEHLEVPEHEVRDVYLKELDRLASHARIPNYLGVLAARHTHSVLHGRRSAGHG